MRVSPFIKMFLLIATFSIDGMAMDMKKGVQACQQEIECSLVEKTKRVQAFVEQCPAGIFLKD
jgi:hypothetical protein